MTNYCRECGRRLLGDWCSWCARQSGTVSIGRFEVRGVLGTGRFGRVLLARDPGLGRLVALRVIPTGTEDSDQIRTYLSTVGRLSGLHHPNCIEIYSILESEKQQSGPVIVMEHAPGPTLEEATRKASATTVVATLQGVLAGLEFLHSNSLPHGRLSPGNILLSASGETKLADAGMGEDPEHARAWALAAPETLLGSGPSRPADVFTIGALTWWLLSRRPPFRADSRQQAVMARHREPEGTVPDDLRPILLAALEVDPANRPSAASLRSGLIDATDFWLTGRGDPARPFRGMLSPGTGS